MQTLTQKISEILLWIIDQLVIISVLSLSVVLPVYYHAITMIKWYSHEHKSTT